MIIVVIEVLQYCLRRVTYGLRQISGSFMAEVPSNYALKVDSDKKCKETPLLVGKWGLVREVESHSPSVPSLTVAATPWRGDRVVSGRWGRQDICVALAAALRN